MAPPGARAASSPRPRAGYRPCVGLMLLNPDGHLFIGERCGRAGGAWQMPLGGIDPG